MHDSEGFSAEVPRTGAPIEYVEFGYQPKTRTAGPLTSVKGPFRFAPHDAYECTTEGGDEVVIFHLQPGDEFDEERKIAYRMLTGVSL